MKKIIILSLLLFACFAIIFAQDTLIKPDSLPKFDSIFDGSDSEVVNRLLTWYNAALIFIIYFTTYVSRYIPFLNQVENKAWRAALIALMIGAIFYRLGADGLGVVVSFLMIANPYEMLMKPVIGKTKESAPVTEADADDSVFS